MKKLILVTSPPACGKTFISREISKALDHVVYLDKDTLIPLSKQIFLVANQEYNRSSDFFEEYIRNPEYDVVVDFALEALDYDDTVLINAPFTRELRDKDYMRDLKAKLAQKGAELVIIWVETAIEVCHQRMIERNSDRDTWKLEHWDEYVKKCNFDRPVEIDDPTCVDEILIFKNSSQEEFDASIKEIVAKLNA